MQLLLKKKNKFPQSIEYKGFQKLRVLSLFFLGLIGVVFILLIYFIYQQIFLSIEQINSVIIPKDELVQEVIDFDKFDKVKSTWNSRLENPMPEIVRDPFNPAVTAPADTEAGVEDEE